MRRPHLLLLLGFLAFPGCAKAPDFWKDVAPGQKRVLVSFPPLYAITHAVAGERAYVLCMLTTEGPHAYRGHQNDLLKVNKADLFIYNGLTLDDVFTSRMLTNHKNKDLVTLNVGAVLDAKDADIPEKKGQFLIRGEKMKHGDHWHGAEDPHYWLSPKVAMAMTEIIAEKLAEIDPDGAPAYRKRAAELVKKFQELKEYGDAAFKDKKSKKFITMHDSFAYFARDFDLKVADKVQEQPGADPNAATMARLIKLCRSQEIAAIAIEPQFPDAQAKALRESLKREGIDIQIITLDPLETADAQKGKVNPDPGYYLQKMRENIDTLAKALP